MEDPPINHSSITSIKYELVHNIQGKAAFKESEFSGFCYQLPSFQYLYLYMDNAHVQKITSYFFR